MPRAAKLLVQIVAEYYSHFYGLGAPKGQLEHRRGNVLPTPSTGHLGRQRNAKQQLQKVKDEKGVKSSQYTQKSEETSAATW